MRRLPLLALLLAAPALAQEPAPDTTAPWRYFPLEVGNVWEYRLFQGTFLERRRVVGTTVADGETYFRYRVARYDADGELTEPPETYAVRFDTTTASVVAADGELPFPVTSCPLDIPFGARLGGAQGAGCYTWGGLQTVQIGEDTLRTTVKTYENHVELTSSYAADVGLWKWSTDLDQAELTYARVGGVEYGAPAVAAEPGEPAAPTLRLEARPNPAGRSAAVTLTLPASAAARLAAYDALGREVAVVYEGPLAAGERAFAWDVSGLAPGVYVIRAEGRAADGRFLSATARVTLAR